MLHSNNFWANLHTLVGKNKQGQYWLELDGRPTLNHKLIYRILLYWFNNKKRNKKGQNHFCIAAKNNNTWSYQKQSLALRAFYLYLYLFFVCSTVLESFSPLKAGFYRILSSQMKKQKNVSRLSSWLRTCWYNAKDNNFERLKWFLLHSK